MAMNSLLAAPRVRTQAWPAAFSAPQTRAKQLPCKCCTRPEPDGRGDADAPKTQDRCDGTSHGIGTQDQSRLPEIGACRPAQGYKALQSGDRLRPDLSGAYKLLANEAMALGIPANAIPELKEDPAFQDVERAYTRLQGIMASFQSADI